MCTAERGRKRWEVLMHAVGTFGETKGGKSQRLAAEDGRLAVHSLSARNSRDRQAAAATAAAILRPAHLAHARSGENQNKFRRYVSQLTTRVPLCES